MTLTFSEIVERMKKVGGFSTYSEVAEALDVTPQAMSNFKSKGELPPNLVIKFAEKYKVSVDWLLWGGDSPEVKIVPPYPCPCLEDFSYVSKYEFNLAAGAGTYVLSQNVKHQYAFRTEWLNRCCQKNQCGLFTVRGNSMLPGIGDGDLVLVDMSKKEMRDIIDGQIYAFSEGDLLKVKRLVKKGSTIIAVSDNKAELPDPMEVDMEQFRLIGRVIWVGHEYKIE